MSPQHPSSVRTPGLAHPHSSPAPSPRAPLLLLPLLLLLLATIAPVPAAAQLPAPPQSPPSAQPSAIVDPPSFNALAAGGVSPTTSSPPSSPPATAEAPTPVVGGPSPASPSPATSPPQPVDPVSDSRLVPEVGATVTGNLTANPAGNLEGVLLGNETAPGTNATNATSSTPPTVALTTSAPPPPPPPPTSNATNASAPLYFVPPLPYAYDALEPVIDTETMRLHHDRHHAAYVNALNTALVGAPPDIRSWNITELNRAVGRGRIRAALGNATAVTVFNNAGGHWNHAFLWKIMAPVAESGTPSANLSAAINQAFGSLDGMFTRFNNSALGRFGSGWAWVCVQPAAGNQLGVTSTPNQVNPLQGLADTQCIPILGIDVWEHAYYLKYRNVRSDYVAAWKSVINWARVSETYEAAVQGRVLDVV